MSALLQIEDLEVTFERDGVESRALRGVSLAVDEGEVLGVVGETGCGKTLTGLSVLGLLPRQAVTAGSISFAGSELTTLGERTLAGLRGHAISMIFQSPSSSFNPVFTVGDQLAHVARRHLQVGRGRARALVRDALAEVGLPAPERTMRFYPHELSGGMLQRAMIAMAILCRPRLLIADEPTTALDVTVAEQILLLLRELQHEHGHGVLFISHDLELVGDFCDRVAVMYAGRVVESGPASELLARPRHPYTRALLDALPGRSQPRSAIPTVRGTLPTGDLDRGCAFAERCPLVEQRCRDIAPNPCLVGELHTSSCHRWECL